MQAAEETFEFPETLMLGDGDTVDGRLRRVDEGPTRGYGTAPILIMRVAGKERSVWVLHQALRSRLAEELGRRETGEFEPDERIIITRKGSRVAEASGRSYTDYAVHFPERPSRPASSI